MDNNNKDQQSLEPSNVISIKVECDTTQASQDLKELTRTSIIARDAVRDALRPLFARGMTADAYREQAGVFIDDKGSEMNNLLHAALGIAGEGGEVVDLIKKSWAYGKPLSREKLLEEIGDQLWYINLMLRTLNVTWGEVFTANVNKLSTRYPDKCFKASQAINRNVEAERAAVDESLKS